MRSTEKEKQVVRWAAHNIEDWYTVCGKGKYPIDEQEYLRLHNALMEHDLEQLTVVLFTCHCYAVSDRVQKSLEILKNACEKELSEREIIS